MNEEQERVQKMLDRATAPGDDTPADLDAETSSLRETWLALGRLLEDAHFASGEELDRWKVAPRPVPRHHSLVLTVVVAALLLIAVGVTMTHRLRDGSQVVPSGPSQIVQDRGPSVVPSEDTPRATPQSADSGVRVPNAADLAWDDSLDEEITTVAQAAISVRNDWFVRAGGASAIEYGLEQIRQDIEDETL